MWQTIGVISTVVALFISLIALIISILALAASVVFYFKSARQLTKSTRRLQNTMNILGKYLKATIKDADVTLNFDEEGDLIGLNITRHLGGVQAEGNAGGVVPGIGGDKKTD